MNYIFAVECANWRVNEGRLRTKEHNEAEMEQQKGEQQNMIGSNLTRKKKIIYFLIPFDT